MELCGVHPLAPHGEVRGLRRRQRRALVSRPVVREGSGEGAVLSAVLPKEKLFQGAGEPGQRHLLNPTV